jgi:Flp pilus assembly protein CpaB
VENIMSSKLFTTRQGTILLGVSAAVIAAIALLVYLNHYRNNVNSGAGIKVLVAQKLIEKNTPGDVIRTTSGFYALTDFQRSQVENGAIVDPATLTGKVATTDIGPGQQLTAADFGPATSSVQNSLGRNQRAVVVSLGSPQAVGGQIGPGSHVDVYVTGSSQSSTGVNQQAVVLAYQNMYVMNAGTNGGNVTVRATPQQAGKLIWASQYAHIYLTLRPTVGSIIHGPAAVIRGN